MAKSNYMKWSDWKLTFEQLGTEILDDDSGFDDNEMCDFARAWNAMMICTTRLRRAIR